LKAIPKFNGYLADKSGNIYSAKPWGGNRGRGAKVPSEPRLMKPKTGGSGYLLIGLWQNGKQIWALVHRLILETFIGECPDGMWARHLDGNRLNNVLGNLMWDTPKNNMGDKIKHGTLQRGENHEMAKLSNLQVRIMRRCVECGMTQTEMARIFNVTQPSVSMVIRKHTWKHLS
jgi:predicted XRE-type DNA-binding protein